jgi:hypothetical protein
MKAIAFLSLHCTEMYDFEKSSRLRQKKFEHILPVLL